eukprot:tig00020564_g11427.t1
MDRASARYRERMDSLSAFLSYNRVPSELSRRIKSFFEHFLRGSFAFDEERLLEELSIALRTDLAMFRHKDMLLKSPLFRRARSDQRFLERTVLALRRSAFGPGDQIFFEGEKGYEMFFIAYGRVRIAKNVDGGEVTTITTLSVTERVMRPEEEEEAMEAERREPSILRVPSNGSLAGGRRRSFASSPASRIASARSGGFGYDSGQEGDREASKPASNPAGVRRVGRADLGRSTSTSGPARRYKWIPTAQTAALGEQIALARSRRGSADSSVGAHDRERPSTIPEEPLQLQTGTMSASALPEEPLQVGLASFRGPIRRALLRHAAPVRIRN